MSLPLLIEIGCEEIPARFFPALSQDFQTRFTNCLTQNNLSFSKARSLATYRRLTLIVEGLPEQQPDQTLSIKGPPAQIAQDADGNWLPPALGFAKKNGVSANALSLKDLDGKKYVFVEQHVKGQATANLLPDFLTQVFSEIKLPIAMRWGNETVPFIRPINWIVFLLGETVIPFSRYEIQSGNQSYGHRFLTQNPDPKKSIWGQPVTIRSADSYIDTLKTVNVYADPQERTQLIQDAITAKNAQISEALLSEVTYLTEWPTLLQGTIEDSFLSLPKEVLIDCMVEHQKYIHIEAGNHLSPNYLIVADNVTEANQKTIIEGNNKVLKARLNDMQFFWEEDQKTPLAEHAKKLARVTYQKNLGSVEDKVKRVVTLCEQLIQDWGLSASKDDILQTAKLCKADLVTNMVFEAAGLQGIMGRLYAEKEGLPKDVAIGIEAHYKPRFADDDLPENDCGFVVGIADRLDTVASSFATGYKPSGSQDPLGVRRALLGIFKLLNHQKRDLSFASYYQQTFANLGKGDEHLDRLLDFTKQRFKTAATDELGLSYDCVDAVLSQLPQSYLDTLQKASLLHDIKTTNTETLKQVSETAIRISRLSKEAAEAQFDTAVFQEQIEKEAAKHYDNIATQMQDGALSFSDQFKTLENLNSPMTQYFDQVMVMTDNPSLKNARLGFLASLRSLYHHFADFEQLVI